MAPERTISSPLVSARFQAIAFTISLIALSIALTIRYQSFVNIDPPYLLEQDIHSTTHPISSGLHILQFNKFYVVQNTFEFSGIIWFSYDPSTIPLSLIKKFSIDNGEIIQVSEPLVTEVNGTTTAYFRIHAKFHSQLNYLLFPFDDHTINIVIANDFLPAPLFFTASESTLTLDQSFAITGWHVLKEKVTAGYSQVLPPTSQSEGTIQKKIVFSLAVEHNNPMLTINIVLTLFLLLFMTLLTFSSDQDCVLIVTVGIVALIGYRFVMQSYEPVHVSYFTLADYMYFFALVGTILTLFGGIIVREKNSPLVVKHSIIAGIYALFVGGCIVTSFLM